MKVSTHNGVDIHLSEDKGDFYADPKGGRQVRDKTLDGLKAKLDGLVRGRVREEALNLPAVVISMDRNGYGREATLTYIEEEGTFKGVNAHTGDITFTRARDGKVVNVSGWWYPKDHPDLPRIRELAAASVAAYKANKAAQGALENALQVNGLQPRVSTGYRENKTAAAARTEEELVKHLQGEPDVAAR